MEDILAIIAVLALVVAFSFGLRAFLRYRDEQKAEHQRKQEESDKFWEAERARTKKLAQERTLARMSTPPPPKQLDVYASGVGVGRSTYAPQPVQSSSLLSDIADVAMIANTVRHWNDNRPHVTNTDNPIDFPKEERSVGVSKSESSWGFDDSDSRKSISDSMDTSSSWSSSDSGPSSDW